MAQQSHQPSPFRALQSRSGALIPHAGPDSSPSTASRSRTDNNFPCNAIRSSPGCPHATVRTRKVQCNHPASAEISSPAAWSLLSGHPGRAKRKRVDQGRGSLRGPWQKRASFDSSHEAIRPRHCCRVSTGNKWRQRAVDFARAYFHSPQQLQLLSSVKWTGQNRLSSPPLPIRCRRKQTRTSCSPRS